MRIALCVCVAVLLLVTALWATAFTITVTVDTAMATDILATVTAWRGRQLDNNGNPIYANNTEVGQAILYNGLRRILKDQCEFDPVSCPPTIKAFLDARNSAQQSFESEINNAVTP